MIPKQRNLTPIEIANFHLSQRETAAWCERRFARGDPRNSLRSERLTPVPPLATRNDDWEAVATTSVAHVIHARRAALSEEKMVVDRCPAPGRLLLLDMAINLWHGLGESGTGGFIDASDMPPWDSWVAYFPAYLLAWVPEAMVRLVEIAINADPVASLQWADQYDASDWQALWRQLRAPDALA